MFAVYPLVLSYDKVFRYISQQLKHTVTGAIPVPSDDVSLLLTAVLTINYSFFTIYSVCGLVLLYLVVFECYDCEIPFASSGAFYSVGLFHVHVQCSWLLVLALLIPVVLITFMVFILHQPGLQTAAHWWRRGVQTLWMKLFMASFSLSVYCARTAGYWEFV